MARPKTKQVLDDALWGERGRTPLNKDGSGAAREAGRVASAERKAQHALGSEKMRLARVLWNEAACARIFSGMYKVWHEEYKQYVPWMPPPWLEDFVRAFYAGQVRNLHAKGRQAFLTSTYGVMMLDMAMFWNGAKCIITNYNRKEAESTLADKVGGPLTATFGNGGEQWTVAIPHIKIHRIPRSMSSEISTETSGRGATPMFILHTEFPKLAAALPNKAKEVFDSATSGAQFASHNFEGTISTLGSGGIMLDAINIAVERQKAGYAPTGKDFDFWFTPWFAKESYWLDPKTRPAGKKMSRELVEYFKQLECADVDYQIANKHFSGGVHLSDGQKWWMENTLAAEKQNDMKRFFADYPALLGEAYQAATVENYLFEFMEQAREEGRVRHCELRGGVAVEMFSDWGWNDQTVIIFAQPMADGRKWQVLGDITVDHWGFNNVADAIREHKIFRDLGGRRGTLWLPFDAEHTGSGTAIKMSSGKMDTSIKEEMQARGFVCGVMSKVARKDQNFAFAREHIRDVVFDNEDAVGVMDALRNVRQQVNHIDGVRQNVLARSVYNHRHDAFVVLCRRMAEWVDGDVAGMGDYCRGLAERGGQRGRRAWM